MTHQPICWICKAAADSSEHRLKKTDLTRAYGKGPYRGAHAPVHVRDGVVSPVQGPRSSRVKYDQSLCYACNTARTQPFDMAYERLIAWIVANEATVLRKRLLDFEEIYGQGWQDCQLNLFKYCVKSFGCRLVDAGRIVPQDLVELMPLRTFLTGLKITFSVNEDVLLLDKNTQDGFIGKGDLVAWATKEHPSVATGYSWNEHVSWFTILYWYCQEPQSGRGSIWIANSQHVYLGSLAPLTPEQRTELVAKAANGP